MRTLRRMMIPWLAMTEAPLRIAQILVRTASQD